MLSKFNYLNFFKMLNFNKSSDVFDSVPEIGFLETWNQPRKMGFRQDEQSFSSFFAIFDDFSKWSTPKVLRMF